MSIIGQFNAFAADFEACVAEGRWERLADYFTEDATYENVGAGGAPIQGRSAIIDYFRQDVTGTDRRFDSRTLVAVTEPRVRGNRLSRLWRCTYTLAGTPDLVVDGEARYEFDGKRIRLLEQELTPESLARYARWMQAFGERLMAANRPGSARKPRSHLERSDPMPRRTAGQ